ncbi:hypothetical protein CPB85DRAFT_741123 [Mucidula mucida]|nr:hypothetical protein CPB85DRAFT_741123 [Mucidula mucida]
MDTMSWILELYTTWYYFVLQYRAGPEALLNPIWALKVNSDNQCVVLGPTNERRKLEPGFTYTTAFVANLFFIEKIYIVMGRNLYVSLPLVFLAVSAWGLGLAITGLVFDLNAVVSPDINHVTLAQKVVSTLVEILIMVMMCYVFRSGQLGFSRRTDRSLSRLIIFAASRGVIMSIVQIVYTVVFFVYPHKLIWVVFHFILGKLFSNSVLASLNVRKIMRGNHSTEPTSTFHLSTGDLSGGSEPQTNSSSTRRTQNSGFMQFAPGKTHDSTMSIEV